MISTPNAPSRSNGQTNAPPYRSSPKAPASSFMTEASSLLSVRPPQVRSLNRAPMQRRQIPFDAAIEGAPWSVLGGKDADSRTIADLVGAVVEIDHRGTDFDRTRMRKNHAPGDAGVDLDVARQVPGIGEAASKSAAVDSVDAEAEALPAINRPG